MRIISSFKPPKPPGMPVGDRPTGYGAGGYGAAPPRPPVAPVNKPPAAGAGGNQPKAATAPATPTPAATPSTPAATPNTPTRITDPSQSIYNLDTDPIVAKIKALNTANYGTAVAGAQSSAKQDLINSGFSLADIIAQNPDLASSPIGSVLGDQATSLAAQQNPYSTLAELNQANTAANQGIDQTANDNNLFYSSTRGNELSDQSHAYLGNVAGARGSLADALGQLITGLSTEQNTENSNLADAYDQARQNAVTNGINSGEVLLGYDGNGNPIFRTAVGASGDTGAGSPGLNESPGGPLDFTGFDPSAFTGMAFQATPAQLAAALASTQPKAKATAAKTTPPLAHHPRP